MCNGACACMCRWVLVLTLCSCHYVMTLQEDHASPCSTHLMIYLHIISKVSGLSGLSRDPGQARNRLACHILGSIIADCYSFTFFQLASRKGHILQGVNFRSSENLVTPTNLLLSPLNYEALHNLSVVESQDVSQCRRHRWQFWRQQGLNVS